VTRFVLLFVTTAVLALGLDTTTLKPRGYVNDFAGALDARGAQTLETYCAAVEQATQAQIAIVIVKSLDDDPIEYVAEKLFKEWGIGKKGTDEGLLLIMAIQDRKYRAEVGFGLEPIITDGYAGDVWRSVKPILRQGDYGGALYAAVRQFGDRIAGSKGVSIGGQPIPRRTRQNPAGSFGGAVLGFLMLLFFLAVLSGGRRGGGGGGAGSLLTGMLLGSMMGRGRGDSGWGGGGFGGGGGGGGGFGGFGGGGSGGGGASGGW